MANRLQALASLVIICLINRCDAYPDRFMVLPTTTCTTHPAKGYGGHPSVKANTATTFALSLKGTPSTTVCPGNVYDLTIKQDAEGHAYITSSVGKLDGGSDPDCPNRLVETDSAASTWETTLAVPCLLPAGGVDVKITWAEDLDQSFQQASASFAEGDACTPVATCPGTAAPPPLLKNATAPPPSLKNATAPPPSNLSSPPPATGSGSSPPASTSGNLSPPATAFSTSPPPASAALPSSAPGALLLLLAPLVLMLL